MNKIKSGFLPVLLCGILALPLAYAQQKSEDAWAKRNDLKEKMIQSIYNQLNLTAEQKSKIELNKLNQQKTMKASYEQMKSLRGALNQELMKPVLQMDKVNTIHAKLKSTQAQMMDQRLSSILEVRNILTPEQFNQFLLLMEEQRSKMWSHGSGDGKS